MNTSIQIDPVKDGKRLLMVCVAAFIMALNIRTLVHTGGLIPGGATGMTILIQRLAKLLLSVDLPYTPVNLLLNAIPVYIGFRFIGKKFTLLSLVMIMLSGFLTDLIPAYTLTQDILLISIFGGIVNGFAISLCLRADATSGGTDFIAIYLSQMHGVESWNLILGFNVVLLLIGGYFFGPDKALYSIIFQYASTQVLHLMHRNYQKVTFLIVHDPPRRHDLSRRGRLRTQSARPRLFRDQRKRRSEDQERGSRDRSFRFRQYFQFRRDHGELLYAAKRLTAPAFNLLPDLYILSETGRSQ